jgi:phage protein D
MTEAPLSAGILYSARPTVRIDDQEYPKVTELLIAMEVTEREGGLSSLELRLSNVASDPQGRADFAFESGTVLTLGAAITIYSGDALSPQEIFRGKITGLEADFSTSAPPELVVLAEDLFQQARMARRTVTHENVTIAQLANELASALGLTPIVTGLRDNIGTQVQLNESDLAFFRRVLARYDADMQVVGTELHISPRQDVRRGTVTLEMYGQLLRARVTADLAHQVTEVTVSGWDPLQGQAVQGSSTGAHLGPGSGKSGAHILQDAIAARPEHIGHLAASTDAEAQAMAEAAFDQRARRFVTVDATAEGNPALRVGTHVELQGLGPRFDNTYYIVEACHRWDLTRGYETDFQAECAYWGGN